MYLLDTNTCIRYLNGLVPAIRDHFQAHSADEIFVCSIVKAELYFGASKSNNPTRTLEIQNKFLSQFISLPFDDTAAVIYGQIRAELSSKGRLIGPNDLLIASIAISNQLTLVTHNTGEFSRLPQLQLQDWELDLSA